jgi:hypothetical protein
MHKINTSMLSFKQFLLEAPRLQNTSHSGPLGTTRDDIIAAKKFWRKHIRKPAAIAALTGALLLGLHGGKSMAPTPTVSTRPAQAPVATEVIRNK